MNAMVPLAGILIPLGGAAASALLGFAVRGLVLPRLLRLAAHTSTRVDDIVLRAVRSPSILWCTLLGVHVAVSFGDYTVRVAETLHAAIVVLVIVSISWTVARVAGELVRMPPHEGAALPSARILSSAAQAAVLSVGVLVALQTIGISVAPILTALGVGGLAVGLALQDTLANLFAGFHILVSRQVRPGDFVQLASGEQGYVDDITWRTTTIRQLPNNIVIVPNALLAKAITVNYSLPDAEQAVLLDVGVSYDEDLPTVERVTIDVARTVQRDVEGALPAFDPFIRFHTFADSSVNFTVIMRARAFTDTYLMKHAFVKRLHARFRMEGITIPYPQRTVHLAPVEPAPRQA